MLGCTALCVPQINLHFLFTDNFFCSGFKNKFRLAQSKFQLTWLNATWIKKESGKPPPLKKNCVRLGLVNWEKAVAKIILF